MSTGIAALDRAFGGGVLERSVTIVSGSAGVGKSLISMQFALAGGEEDQPAIYIAREEGPKQLLATADALGIPLQAAVDARRIEILFLSREDIRAAQLLTILTEKIRARNVRRLVLDSATQLESDELEPREFPQLLGSLVLRLKALGVTSFFTLESKPMFARDTVTDQGLSPVADNLLMLRYRRAGDGVENTATVVKTRSSAHSGTTLVYSIAPVAFSSRVNPRGGRS